MLGYAFIYLCVVCKDIICRVVIIMVIVSLSEVISSLKISFVVTSVPSLMG